VRWSECFLDSLSESQRTIIDALRLFDLASVHYDTLAVLVTSTISSQTFNGSLARAFRTVRIGVIA
jgi:hypothetical protein